eukprot:sb/3466389/
MEFHGTSCYIRVDFRFYVVRSDEDTKYTGPEPYQSNDIKLLKLEIETAETDLKKMRELRGECEILEWKCIKPPVPAGGEKKKSGQRKRKMGRKPDTSDTESVASSTASGGGGGKFNAQKWLSKYGLAAQRLTIMDALAPTVITQNPKYVGILKKKVHAKVFDGVMPFTFHSADTTDSLKFVNPSAVDLVSYEDKVKRAIEMYDRKLAGVVWRSLPEKKGLKEEPRVFMEHREVLRKALDGAGWPVAKKTIRLMEEEIELGNLYLTQSEQLRNHVKPPEKLVTKYSKPILEFAVSDDNCLFPHKFVFRPYNDHVSGLKQRRSLRGGVVWGLLKVIATFWDTG